MIEKIGSKIVEPILDGIFGFFREWIASMLEAILSYFTEGFAPDMGTFRSYLGSGNVASIQQVLTYTGIGIASVLFLFGIFMYAFQNFTDNKDSLQSLFFRYIVALLLVGSGMAFFEDWVLGTAQNVYTWIMEINIQRGNVADYTNSLFDRVWEDLKINTDVPGFFILQAILYIVFAITIMINFIKFALEVIERYVVMSFLLICFPVAAATYTSKTSQRIFSSYIRMLISEICMLVLNEIFIVGFLAMTATGTAASQGIIGMAFIIAYLRIAQRADGMLRSLGLSTAQTGGSLMNEAQGALLSIAGMARMAGFAAGSVTGAVGSRMAAAGVANGDYSKFVAGQNLSNSAKRRGSMPDSDSQNIKKYMQSGGRLDPEDDSARNAAARAAMTSGYKDLANMPQDMQEAVVKQTMGDSIATAAKEAGFENAELKDITVGGNGNISAKMSYGDGREMPVNLSKTQPKDPTSAIGTVNDMAGNQMYLSRAETANDTINKARGNGTLNAANPDVMDAASRLMATNGAAALKNVPHDVQSAAVQQSMGEGVAEAAKAAGFDNAKLKDVSIGGNGNIAANMSYGEGREMPVNLTKTPPKDPTSAICSVTDASGNQMYLSRAESANDTINKARESGTLNTANPDVMDAASRLMATYGAAALKNVPQDVQSSAFQQVHGSGFNRLSNEMGLGVNASDLSDISIDGAGNIHGNATIAGREMNFTISPSQPKDDYNKIGSYQDSNGKMQYVSATPSSAMDIGTDIEYKSAVGINGAPSSVCVASSSQNAGADTSIKSDAGESITGNKDSRNLIHGEQSAISGESSATGGTPAISSGTKGSTETDSSKSASITMDSNVKIPVSTGDSTVSQITGEDKINQPNESTSVQDGNLIHGEQVSNSNGNSSSDSSFIIGSGAEENAEIGSLDNVADSIGNNIKMAVNESDETTDSIAGIYENNQAYESSGTQDEENLIHGEQNNSEQSDGIGIIDDSGNEQIHGAISESESTINEFESVSDKAIDGQEKAEDAISSDVTGTDTYTMDSGYETEDNESGSTSDETDHPEDFEPIPFNESNFADEQMYQLMGNNADVQAESEDVFDTGNANPSNPESSIDEEEENNIGDYEGNSKSSSVSVSNSPEVNMSEISAPQNNSSSSGTVNAGFNNSMQKTASEIAVGVNLDRRWKAANAQHLEGARFTPTSGGGVELRNYDDNVMMYQDSHGGQHYSFGTKVPNEADFQTGGTYETAGFSNVKITGRNADGSFTFEADGYDRSGQPSRQKYLAKDYACHHDEKGRVIKGNRSHKSLLVTEVSDRKNIYGGKGQNK